MTVFGEQEKNLVVTGLSMGLIHVLAGPDHLSALAALAVGTSYKSFMLGFRWGIGHSTGLIVVAIIFIALKGDLDLRTMGRYCDSLVGIFMISLGCYGVISAIRSYREKRQKRDVDYVAPHHRHRSNKNVKTFKKKTSSGTQQSTELNDGLSTVNNNGSNINNSALRRAPSSSSALEMTTSSSNNLSSNTDDTYNASYVSSLVDNIDETSVLLSASSTSSSSASSSSSTTAPPTTDLESANTDHLHKNSSASSTRKKVKTWWSLFCEDHHHHHDFDYHDEEDSDFDHGQGPSSYEMEECSYCPFINMQDPATQRLLSFSIGLLHGVAGPGGILGVLPAVEMQKWTSSVLYLGSFILASTLSMGTFAAMYGECTRRLGATTETMELSLSVFSSGMSIIVGVIWFVFSILGKLDEFFH